MLDHIDQITAANCHIWEAKMFFFFVFFFGVCLCFHSHHYVLALCCSSTPHAALGAVSRRIKEHSFPAETLADPSALWCSCRRAHAVPTANRLPPNTAFTPAAAVLPATHFTAAKLFSLASLQICFLVLKPFALHPADTDCIQAPLFVHCFLCWDDIFFSIEVALTSLKPFWSAHVGIYH